jgi:hypothetical protein
VTDEQSYDEAWAQRLMDDLDRGKVRADQRRRLFVEQCEVMAGRLWKLGTTDWPVRPSSIRETDGGSDIQIGESSATAAELVKTEVSVHLRSAADHLRGFAAIVDAQTSFVGGVTVGRGFFEACVWTLALVDHRLTSEQRAQRALTRRLSRLSSTIRLGKHQEELFETPPGEREEKDPALEVSSILATARERQWEAGRSRFGHWVGTPLSVDGLIRDMETLEGSASQYVWVKGSSTSHAEHAADVMGWMDLVVHDDRGTTPGWLTVLHSPGVLIGLTMVCDQVGRYVNVNILRAELAAFSTAWWSSNR